MLTSLAPHSLLLPCKEVAGRSTYLCPCPLPSSLDFKPRGVRGSFVEFLGV